MAEALKNSIAFVGIDKPQVPQGGGDCAGQRNLPLLGGIRLSATLRQEIQQLNALNAQ